MNTLARSVAARWRIARDDGAAMVLVMAWSLVVFGLALVIVQSVIRQIGPSDHAERSFAALAAAEAGIEDYRARVLAHTDYTYYSRPDPTNSALGGWAPLPGGNTSAQFTYAIDASRVGVGGELTIVSTGRSQGVTRTIESILARRSTLDYVYMSDIESTAPYMPGAYSTTKGDGGTDSAGKQLTGQELAEKLCARRWWDKIPDNGQVKYDLVSPTASGLQRNQNFCQYADITSSETLAGPIHSNDIFRLGISLYGEIDATEITSSCPTTAAEQRDVAQGAGGVLCPTAHRYIDGTTQANPKKGANGTPARLIHSDTINGNYKVWNATTNAYQGDTWLPAGTTGLAANPAFDTVLQLPKNPDRLVVHASDTGCVYTGPTRIRFDEFGYMYVTSPDTKYTNPLCAGGTANGLFGSANAGTTNITKRISLAQFTNLVIYVQSVKRPGDANTDDNQYIADNQWVEDTEPTCVYKPTRLVAASGKVGSISTGLPWTATITLMGSTQGLAVGSVFTATAGAGSIGTGGVYTVTDVSTSSLSYTSSTGTTPKGGLVTAITRSPIKYPYVIPDSALDTPASSGFNTTRGNTYGFPSEFAPTNSPYFGSSCASGDVYIQGKFMNSVTIATANNIVITRSLTESGSSGVAGNQPASDAMFGLVSNQFTYIYRPLVSAANKGTWPPDWPAGNISAPIVDASILAVNQCLSSQREFSTGSAPNGDLTNLTIWGSIAQKYRCPVGQPGTIYGGYMKNYHHDARLATRTPPYLIELSSAPWKRNQYTELTPVVQSAGTRSWPLATANDLIAPASTFANLSVAYGPATATLVNGGTASLAQAQVVLTSYPLTTGKSGLVLLTYDVTKSVGSPAVAYTETRRLAIQVK
jgi:hypothetical protein